MEQLELEGDGWSETFGDLAMGMFGCLAIAFAGYVLTFRSQLAAEEGPKPPGSVQQGDEQGGPTHQDLLAENGLLKAELRKAREEARTLEESVASPQLFGLNGPLTGVVFLVDLSGSMVGHTGQANSWPNRVMEERFRDVKRRLSMLIRTLRMKQFTVIGFGGGFWDKTSPRLVYTSRELVDASPTARADVARELMSWQANGGTPTLSALKAALEIEGTEHIILLTDGMPTIGGDQSDVLRFLDSDPRSFVLDVIGIGDQTKTPDSPEGVAMLDFTRGAASRRGGFFQAW